MPEARTTPGWAAPSSAARAASRSVQVGFALRPYNGSSAVGTPTETKVELRTTGGLTGAPTRRSGRPATTATVAGDRDAGSLTEAAYGRSLLAFGAC